MIFKAACDPSRPLIAPALHSPYAPHVTRYPDEWTAGLSLGAVIAGAVALVAPAASEAVPSPRRRVVVGGVDLTGVDASRPFQVDFSVDPAASTEQKRTALARLRTALIEIQSAYPNWLCQTEAAATKGIFVLHVQPLQLHQPRHA